MWGRPVYFSLPHLSSGECMPPPGPRGVSPQVTPALAPWRQPQLHNYPQGLCLYGHFFLLSPPAEIHPFVQGPYCGSLPPLWQPEPSLAEKDPSCVTSGALGQYLSPLFALSIPEIQR